MSDDSRHTDSEGKKASTSARSPYQIVRELAIALARQQAAEDHANENAPGGTREGMRVAIYARFSSELQDERSITDQISAAHEHANRHGWSVTAVHSDAAISGSSLKNRPGLLDLIAAAQEHRFDTVLTESLDRLSRDLADIAALYRDLSFLGIRIVTLADGEVGTMHVGLKGIVSQMFLADLAQKTRRGQVGRVKAGRIPGGRCYGYDVVAGDAERGKRRINEVEAAIVRRIFTEYVDGASPLAIAGRLNAEKVPAPWRPPTVPRSSPCTRRPPTATAPRWPIYTPLWLKATRPRARP